MECGLDRTYVSAIERSRWNISLSNIEALAHALGVQAWELLKPPIVETRLGVKKKL
jgi:transcriptional regulator with XRE-family HTH domain